MTSYCKIILTLFSVFFIFSEYSLADCNNIGNNPQGGEIIVCDTDPPNPETNPVITGPNDDDITIQAGAGLNTVGNAIESNDGDDTIVFNDGNTAQDVIISTTRAIVSGPGNDDITINGGFFQGVNDLILTDSGNDNVNVTGATLNGTNNKAIHTQTGNGRVVVNNSILTAGTTGIETGPDDDYVEVNGGSINSVMSCITTEEGDDVVSVGLFGPLPATIISSGMNAIRTGSGNDKVTIVGATLVGNPNDGIFTSSNDDMVIIEDASVTSTNNHAVHVASGNDMVTLRGGELIAENPASFSVRLNTGDDIVRIERQTSLTGEMNGEDGFDTLIFALNIELIPTCEDVKSQILFLSGNDSINIEGFNYSWINFESIQDEITCGQPRAAIPTLSEIGLIAMAGILGIVALITMRRRKIVD